MAAKDNMDGRGGEPECPTDHMRPLAKLPTVRAGWACSTQAGVRPGEWCGRLERSCRCSPRRLRLTHLEAVCLEQPTTTAAAVIVTPQATRSQTR